MTSALSPERKKTIENFYAGAMGRDRDRVRGAITDDFNFRGPVSEIDDPETFVDAMLAVDAIVKDATIIADGDRVAHIFKLDISAPFQAVVPMCDVMTFEGDRISSIQVYTDSALFPSME